MPTRNIVPRANGEGNIGTTNKKWKGINANTVTVDNVEANTVTVDNVEANTVTVDNVEGINANTVTVDNVEANTVTVDNVEANTVTVDNVDVFFMLLKRNKAYKVGDIAYSPNLPSWARLECVVAGTTGRTEPNFSSIEKGDMTNDGTTQFIVDDITDGIPVGDVVFRPYLKDGYLACNGQEVNRSDYPRLVELADKYSLWTDNQTNEPWKFGQGNGSTTMTMPNYLERVVWGGNAAGKREAGLPNITGSFGAVVPGNHSNYCTDAFVSANFERGKLPQTGTLLTDTVYGYRIEASRSSPIYGKSSTVQPPAIVLIPQMKY